MRALFFLVDVTSAHLDRIAKLGDAGHLAFSLDTILPLAEARTAHEVLEGLPPKPEGKIVLRTGA